MFCYYREETHFQHFNFLKQPRKLLSKMILLFFFMTLAASQTQVVDFKYNGFQAANSNMSLDGFAQITSNGLLRITNASSLAKGHAFYSLPIPFKDSSGNAFSFSTTFVIAIVPNDPVTNGHGMAFVISASKDLTTSAPSAYMGLFNASNNGNSSNHIVAIEFDTSRSLAFNDIDDNHVGIDINSMTSVKSAPAAYFTNENGGGLRNLSLASGSPITVWVAYSGIEKRINVILSPKKAAKSNLTFLSVSMDLSSNISDSMYVGFSSATGDNAVASSYVLGWSFKMNGRAQELDLSRLPKLPTVGPKKKSKVLTIGVPSITAFFFLLIVFAIGFIVRRKIKYAEVLEDWEREYGPHRFSYEDLFKATEGFKDRELLGIGGFGMVYRGRLPSSNLEVAVKRVSHKSKQGMREFIAEIVSLGRLRHRNLVQLLGYCRRKGELLLVYDFMPNGSLDKFLFDQPAKILNWHQRFQIIKGVASGLLYLHEGWEKVVLHRDIKASNVLLDGELSGRLGDFGLARLYDHGTNPQTTHVVGTLGYIAPELTRTGKATTSTDVFSFGAFLLEVACGKRPIAVRESPEEMILVDWVLQFWRRGEILEARDVRLGNEYVKEEMELALKLGLLCSHPKSAIRPSMRQVMLFLDWECPLPALPDNGWDASASSVTGEDERLKEMESLYPYGSTNTTEGFFFESSSTRLSECILSGGR